MFRENDEFGTGFGAGPDQGDGTDDVFFGIEAGDHLTGGNAHGGRLLRTTHAKDHIVGRARQGVVRLFSDFGAAKGSSSTRSSFVTVGLSMLPVTTYSLFNNSEI